MNPAGELLLALILGWGLGVPHHQPLSPCVDLQEQSHGDLRITACLALKPQLGLKNRLALSPGWEVRNIFSLLIEEVNVFLELLFQCSKSQQVPSLSCDEGNAFVLPGLWSPPLAFELSGEDSDHLHYNSLTLEGTVACYKQAMQHRHIWSAAKILFFSF